MNEARKASLLLRVKQFGGPLNEPAVLAQFLAQVYHESGGLKYVKEIWGPTAAQKRYEGRKDLGNTEPGDGKRFMGRDILQVTGRANYRALTAWVRKIFGNGIGPDFEAKPELLENPEWLGIGACWYFLTRKGLLDACRAGDIERVTRLVNGGLNGYADRQQWYDRAALELLGMKSIREFQGTFPGLTIDGQSGPKTRAALHKALLVLGNTVEAPKPPVQPPPPVTPPGEPQERANGSGGGNAALAVLTALGAAGGAIYTWGADALEWIKSLF